MSACFLCSPLSAGCFSHRGAVLSPEMRCIIPSLLTPTSRQLPLPTSLAWNNMPDSSLESLLLSIYQVPGPSPSCLYTRDFSACVDDPSNNCTLNFGESSHPVNLSSCNLPFLPQPFLALILPKKHPSLQLPPSRTLGPTIL